MLAQLPSSIVAAAYVFIITVLAGLQFRRSRTPLRLGSFVMALFGLSIAALAVVYAAGKMDLAIFWVYQFIAECIAVTWVITTIIHLGYAFYPLTRHQTLIWRVALGSVIMYVLVAIAELCYYIYAVWGANTPIKSPAPVPWIYWLRQLIKVIASTVTILYLFVPLVRHHHSAGVAQIADSNTLAVGAWYLGALGLISLGYGTMLIYFICHPGSAFTLQAQSLDLCIRLLVCPIFSLPPPGFLLRYFHDKYGSATHDTDRPSTMIEAGITNDPRPRRPQMLVSQPASFTSNQPRRNSDYVLDSPTHSYQHHRLSYDPSYQSHPPSLHQQHLQQQRLQQSHRYSISNYVPAFALKDSKLGPVHLDPFRRQQYETSGSEGERRMSGSAGGGGGGGGGGTGSSFDDSVAGSTALSMSGDAPTNASETGLTPTTINPPSEAHDSSDTAARSSQDGAVKETVTESAAVAREETQIKPCNYERRSSLPLMSSPSPSPTPQQLQHQEAEQPQQSQQQQPPQQQQQQQHQDQSSQQEAVVLSLTIPQPLVSPKMTTPSEPLVAFSFHEGYTSPSMVDPRHEEAKQTAQAARRISRRLTMEGRREGMDLLHITSLIKWNNPSPSDNDGQDHDPTIHDSPTASSSRDRLQDIPEGWPRTTTLGSGSSSKPSTPLRELIPQKLGSFFSITKSPITPPSGMTIAALRRNSTTLAGHPEEEEEDGEEGKTPAKVLGAAAATTTTAGAVMASGGRSNRVRRSYDGLSSTPRNSSTKTTTAMEPAHSRDRLRRSQSLTRISVTFPTTSSPAPSPPSLMPRGSSPLASQQQEQGSKDGASNGAIPTSPVLIKEDEDTPPPTVP
ncbi:hypothetical protein DFQ26_004231 [Actinomortierella ambigua]|nr:hypothetical protein DFQ26_004231 [Actinomortierella ambigua]